MRIYFAAGGWHLYASAIITFLCIGKYVRSIVFLLINAVMICRMATYAFK